MTPLTGSALGGIIWPIFLNQLLLKNVGFAWTVRASAFIVLGFLCLANILVRPRSSLARTRLSSAPRVSLLLLLRDLPYMLLMLGYVISILPMLMGVERLLLLAVPFCRYQEYSILVCSFHSAMS